MASLILPSPLPDESLYSLVARMTHANGFPSAPQVCARLFGESDVPRVADIPVDLERFCLETDARYGVLAAVRSHLTLAAFHGLLATHASVERYRRIDASDLGTDTPELSLAGMAHGLPFSVAMLWVVHEGR